MRPIAILSVSMWKFAMVLCTSFRCQSVNKSLEVSQSMNHTIAGSSSNNILKACGWLCTGFGGTKKLEYKDQESYGRLSKRRKKYNFAARCRVLL